MKYIRFWVQPRRRPKKMAGQIEEETKFPSWGIVGHKTYEISRK